MNKRASGFTIVELLIVIVVIAILAAITIVAYNGIQQRANNTSRLAEVQAWGKLFSVYKATNGDWPSAMAAGQTYCLGSGFPVGYGGVARCWNYNSSTQSPAESDSQALMNQLKTAGSLPSGPRQIIGSVMGPYAALQSGYITITMINQGATCPDGTKFIWKNGDSSESTCGINLY